MVLVLAFSFAGCDVVDTIIYSIDGGSYDSDRDRDRDDDDDDDDDDEDRDIGPATFETDSKVVAETEDYAVIIKSAKYTGTGKSLEFDMEIENFSESEAYTFKAGSVYLNSIAAPVSYYSTSVPGGKKATLDFSVESYTMDMLASQGIGDITQIDVTITVHKDSDYKATESYSVTIYPYGEENVVKFEREPQSTDKTLLITKGLEVTFVSFTESDSYYKGELLLYIENNSGFDLDIDADDWAINSYVIKSVSYDYDSTMVMKESNSFWCINFTSTNFEDANVSDADEVEEIEFVFSAEIAGEDSSAFVNETLVINP